MPNILINPNSGVIEFSTGVAGGALFDSNITSGNRAVRLIYDNFGGINLTSYVNITGSGFTSGQDRFSIDGTNGRLFSVTDNLSGSLFSVNDIAGLPIIEAFDDNTVVMGAYNKNDFVLSGNALGLGGFPNTGTTKLYISGNLVVSGNSSFSNRPTVNGSGIALTADTSKIIDKFTPSQNQPPSTGFARFDTRNSILVLDFNDTTNDSGTFVGSIPDTANISNGLNVRINWSATTGTSGSCVWGARFANLSGNLDTISFGTTGFGTGTANSTNGVPTVTQITCTGIGTLTTGSFYRMLVFRNSADTVNDTLFNDAEINFIEVRAM